MANKPVPMKILTQLLDMGPRNVQLLAASGVIPKPIDRKYDLLASVISYIRHLRKLAQGQGSLNLTDVRTRKENARAEREELIVKKLKGELVLRDKVQQWLRGHVEEAKLAFWGLPRRMGAILSPIADEKEIEFLLREEIYKILEEMAKPLHAKKQSRRKNTRKGKR